ncbi:ATP-dependent RNA helicase DHX8 [Sphaerosporella brunnea]|uniref:ATP-dependent RNA helicase DHX8 n=1 Tax=Sphaerosporella brunnea TaxID=1250544 RepID=A0A5J5F2P0_9PEZI|nr:ATP-dependent RNA helicase DHX8 [Sphaerosporella brunnea]
MPTTTTNTTPYRQIRALYDSGTITVYQAYSALIADPAVARQKLSASPHFKFTRMTWIKPSWNWMMYRSGYSHKDERQARILAIKMKREHFEHLLSLACVTNNHTGTLSEQEKKCEVRVQWDPERGVSLEKLDYRSIQIGIGASISEIWANEWIDSIEDVTERAKKMKTLIDEGRVQEASELVPAERPYPLSTDLELLLRME